MVTYVMIEPKKKFLNHSISTTLEVRLRKYWTEKILEKLTRVPKCAELDPKRSV